MNAENRKSEHIDDYGPDLDPIASILEQLRGHCRDDRCTVSIEKWALIRSFDTSGRLDESFIAERLTLVADHERHINLAAHFERAGIAVSYRGRLANFARLIAKYPTEIGQLCDLRKPTQRGT